MRILHISQRYYPAVGGAEIELAKISAHLVAAGHEVVVATSDALDFELFWDPDARRITDSRGEHDGVQIVRFPVRLLPFSPLSHRATRRFIFELSRINIVPARLLMEIARYTPRIQGLGEWLFKQAGEFDLVTGMNVAYERFLDDGLRLARRQGVPFVSIPLTHLGTGDRPATDRMSQYYTMRHQLALVKASSAVVAQTPAEKRFYEATGVPERKIIIGGPGVSPGELAGGDGYRFRQRYNLKEPIITAVGVMSSDKGTGHLVNAMRHLWQAGRQATLVLIGHPLPDFESFFRELPAGDRDKVLFLGPVDDSEKKDALAASNVFALPSRAESFGIVYLEAWMYNLPVIGANIWGVSDLIEDGVDGLLVPFGDELALSQSIGMLLDNPQESIAMGERGRQKVLLQHTWDLKCQLVLDLYEQLTKV